MSAADGSIIPPETSSGARRRRIRTLLFISLTVVVVAALAITSVVVVNNVVTNCADGVEHHGDLDECIGLTDGGYIFREEYRDVENKIREENEFVKRQNKLFVSVAWFEPMTLTDPDTTSPTAVRHRLQGAYIAQYRANHAPAGERANLPLIRLLLANPGSRALQWEPVVAQIKDRQRTDHLVAVAGLGQSLDSTRKAINWLAGNKVPMVAGLITADSMSEPPGEKKVLGLIRAVPTNTDQAKTLVESVKNEARSALLVQDTNVGEVYPKDIGKAFREAFPSGGRTLMPIEEFDSSLGRTVNDFPKMVQEICSEKPDVVFFAGRAVPLMEFLDALAGRSCQSRIVHVLTGDSASNFVKDKKVQSPLPPGVTLEFTNLAYPDAWTDSETFANDSTRFFRENGGRGYFPSDFPDDSAQDGLAITSHDALLWTAVLAARGVVALTKDEHNPPESAAVAAQFDRMHGQFAVPGAGGWISLDENGNPRDKALVIMRVGPGQAIAHTVSSSSGQPCQPGRPPC